MNANSPVLVESLHLAWDSTRQVLLWLAWVVAAALISAGLTWGCGHTVRAARAGLGPAPRVRSWRREAHRGIAELEAYLASPTTAPPPRPDPRELQ